MNIEKKYDKLYERYQKANDTIIELKKEIQMYEEKQKALDKLYADTEKIKADYEEGLAEMHEKRKEQVELINNLRVIKHKLERML